MTTPAEALLVRRGRALDADLLLEALGTYISGLPSVDPATDSLAAERAGDLAAALLLGPDPGTIGRGREPLLFRTHEPGVGQRCALETDLHGLRGAPEALLQALADRFRLHIFCTCWFADPVEFDEADAWLTCALATVEEAREWAWVALRPDATAITRWALSESSRNHPRLAPLRAGVREATRCLLADAFLTTNRAAGPRFFHLEHPTEISPAVLGPECVRAPTPGAPGYTLTTQAECPACTKGDLLGCPCLPLGDHPLESLRPRAELAAALHAVHSITLAECWELAGACLGSTSAGQPGARAESGTQSQEMESA